MAHRIWQVKIILAGGAGWRCRQALADEYLRRSEKALRFLFSVALSTCKYLTGLFFKSSRCNKQAGIDEPVVSTLGPRRSYRYLVHPVLGRKWISERSQGVEVHLDHHLFLSIPLAPTETKSLGFAFLLDRSSPDRPNLLKL